MADLVHDVLALTRGRHALAAMLALLAGYLAVALATPAQSGEVAEWTVGWFVYESGYSAIYLAVEIFLIRSLARSARLPGRPDIWMWLLALVLYGTLMYAGAIVLQVLTYMVIDDSTPSFPVEWYSGLMQILIALALFPLTVWQCALLCGERWIGLLRAWNGTWSRRRHALVVAAIVYVCFGLLGFGIEAIVGPDSAGLPEPVELALLLLPTVASSVLSIVLAFAVFLRIRSEDLESAPFA